MNTTVQFNVNGMHCPDCPTKIEKTIAKLDGVTAINVQLASARGQVTFSPDQLAFVDITEEIRKLGFDVSNSAPIKKAR
ncbi:heavy-metal-associated domain-containing protein [Ornithinibacillus contaminans]|uniref:heavy-metal-associated domain-containing protein n=1 Tax=Ornithinibacillus contaminans TaxID=694055 RepID=UPI00064E14A9|nr:heavy metal-associated domain-containing protein [Ornithinibacillus contaminans]